MTTTLQNDAAFNDLSDVRVLVTREMIRVRTVNLATRNGRSAQEVWASDWEQAVTELTSESSAIPQETVLA